MKRREFIGQPKQEKSVGFCTNYLHYGRLSLKNMKNHKCLDKNCPYLIPFNQHQFWQDRDKKLNDKKLKKRISQNEEVIKHGSAEQIAELFEKIIERGFENV